jgi:hypothetical protein
MIFIINVEVKPFDWNCFENRSYNAITLIKFNTLATKKVEKSLIYPFSHLC